MGKEKVKPLQRVSHRSPLSSGAIWKMRRIRETRWFSLSRLVELLKVSALET
jgi:hypothetical protein